MQQIIEPEVTRRSNDLFLEMKDTVYKSTDKLFGMLLVCEWFAGVLTALLISPRSWSGTHSDLHLHVWTAFILGALIVGRPIYLVHTAAGAGQTRQAVAIGQMLWAALLIHLTGGRIESHFLIFGSLAFLSFYRDKSLLIAASAVVVMDHILRGIFLPISIIWRRNHRTMALARTHLVGRLRRFFLIQAHRSKHQGDASNRR